MLSIEKVLDIPSNHLGGVFTPDSVLVNYSADESALYSNTYDPDNSSWPTPNWGTAQLDTNLPKQLPTAFTSDMFMDLMLTMVVCDGKYMYVHYSPDYGSNYDPKTPYRLYYAHDTDKLYQNVMDEWLFVATKDHTNLLNAGTLTHDEIEEKIAIFEQNLGISGFIVKEW